MKNPAAHEMTNASRIRSTARASALAFLFAVSLLRPAYADPITPVVPANLRVPAGNKVFLVSHAVGTQDYVCLPAGTSFKFKLFTPQATLYINDVEEVATHYFSPNPFVNGAIRATWQHSRDASTVWGHAIETSSDSNFVAPGAIAWLLIQKFGSQEGPAGGASMTATTFIQRMNTAGGVAPSTGCASSADVGNQAFVPYAADYVFYSDEKVHSARAR